MRRREADRRAESTWENERELRSANTAVPEPGTPQRGAAGPRAFGPQALQAERAAPTARRRQGWKPEGGETGIAWLDAQHDSPARSMAQGDAQGGETPV